MTNHLQTLRPEAFTFAHAPTSSKPRSHTLRLPMTVAFAAALTMACASDKADEKPAPSPTAEDSTRDKGVQTKKVEKPSGIDLANFDRSVRPQDDFYRFVNGTWLKTFEIPADKSNYGAFTKLADDSEKNLKIIIDELSSSENAEGSDGQRVGNAYKSFMDEAAIEALGAKPLDDERKKITAIKTADDVARTFGRFAAMGIKSPLVVYVDQDSKNSTAYIAHLYQSGLGLPDRDYYFKTEAQFVAYRDAYVAHVTRVLELAGVKDAAARAKKVLDVETKIATGHWTRADSRDADKAYNKLTTAELAKLSTLKFDAYFQGVELASPGKDVVIVAQPSFVTELGKLTKSVSVADWKNYLEVRLLESMSPYLSKAFVDENFAFYEKTLSGVSEPRPRWKRGVAFVEDSLGFALGKIYVERHFTPEAKARMAVLVENLKRAFAQSIDNLDWMSDVTKKQAHEKLSKFVTKIGYPDTWRDYSALTINADDLVGNVARAHAFEHQRNLKKLGAPVDRNEWFMTPQTVNAYYNSNMNEIVFPAAILQPPFFDLNADDAVNYGGIGAVIGHELGHGFDDQGRKSDGDGNLRDWWTEDDATKFKAKTDILIAQYDAYVPIDDLHVNGPLTLGENIGDLGGMNIAYEAYMLSLDGKDAPIIDEFTGVQRFFIGWSQVWGRKYRDEELRRRLVVDPHSPSEYRVNAIMANMPAFYTAFGVKEGDKLFRKEDVRVKIW